MTRHVGVVTNYAQGIVDLKKKLAELIHSKLGEFSELWVLVYSRLTPTQTPQLGITSPR